jgi:microcystin-dependent protein
MATDKKFSVAGVSTYNGKTKIRFANDSLRIKILTKNGHADMSLIDLPYEMTKAEIAQHLHAVNFANGRPEVIAAVRDLAKKNRVKLDSSSTQVTAEKAEVAVAA